jgi:hypothetical protein
MQFCHAVKRHLRYKVCVQSVWIRAPSGELMSTSVYDWLESKLEPSGARGEDGADVLFLCEQTSLAFRQAVVRGDVVRARSILAKSGASALDVPRLEDVLHILVQQGLVRDVLRAGFRAEDVSLALQQLWTKATVSAFLPEVTAALLDAGFAAAQETRHEIRLKALRSGAWRDVERRL